MDIGERWRVCFTVVDSETNERLESVIGSWVGRRIEGTGPLVLRSTGSTYQGDELCVKGGSKYTTESFILSKTGYVTQCFDFLPEDNTQITMTPACYVILGVHYASEPTSSEDTFIIRFKYLWYECELIEHNKVLVKDIPSSGAYEVQEIFKLTYGRSENSLIDTVIHISPGDTARVILRYE